MKIPDGEVFARGELPNSPEGLYMTDYCPGRILKWVAVKGHADDWCIYCAWGCYSEWWILNHGDKVTTGIYIIRCVPCYEKVLSKYRYW